MAKSFDSILFFNKYKTKTVIVIVNNLVIMIPNIEDSNASEMAKIIIDGKRATIQENISIENIERLRPNEGCINFNKLFIVPQI